MVNQFQYAVRMHADEWKYQLKKQSENQPSMIDQRQWVRPPTNVVKINMDAAFHDESKAGGWGAICRDSSADVHFAAAGPIEVATDALHTETLPLSYAVQVAEQLGVGRVIFETDCSNLHRALVSSDYDLAHIGTIISDLKFRLHMNFIDASVVYAPRICKKPAHELAALGVGVAQGDHAMWTTSYPSSVTRLVTGDLAVS
uniref:Uncharacterized protein n=1 Tax=Avena sativa TaxID=4498 RepID=A0ACD5UGW9_AVESA